ncbi:MULTISPECIES: hypothetical protein [Snodgrassella]|uniref:putative T6SS immunity periplasmic lipoprotein n=1 Tax=Snodgrassella TaxID=1193515 RepID=UPI001EF74BA4|nr:MULTISPECIES: hypothetical protein [Snodgrassella]MCO6518398.1 hypothetical protein [Snodgrassella sp.]
MKQRYSYWLPMFLVLPSLVSCIAFNTPDIVLKNDGQPCISIPLDGNFIRRNKQFKIIFTDVFQTGVGELWSKDYEDSSKPYYVKTQECLRFDYHFQNNITYTIGFISTEKGNNKNKHWRADIRINKNQDGTVQLLLDEHARDAAK